MKIENILPLIRFLKASIEYNRCLCVCVCVWPFDGISAVISFVLRRFQSFRLLYGHRLVCPKQNVLPSLFLSLVFLLERVFTSINAWFLFSYRFCLCLFVCFFCSWDSVKYSSIQWKKITTNKHQVVVTNLAKTIYCIRMNNNFDCKLVEFKDFCQFSKQTTIFNLVR